MKLTIDQNAAEDALLEALDTSKAPQLARLIKPPYRRELRTSTAAAGVVMELDKVGFRRYKRRYPFPRYAPPPSDTAAIRAALNAALRPGFTVMEVIDEGKYIKVIMNYGGNVT